MANGRWQMATRPRDNGTTGQKRKGGKRKSGQKDHGTTEEKLMSDGSDESDGSDMADGAEGPPDHGTTGPRDYPSQVQLVPCVKQRPAFNAKTLRR
jgi:hypothetical protein